MEAKVKRKSVSLRDEKVIYGRNAVLEALKAGKRNFSRLLIAQSASSPKIENIKGMATEAKIVIQFRTRQELNALCGTDRHQGVVGFVTARREFSLEDIFDNALKRNESPFLLLLDRIEDPQNLGALIRTGEAVGIHGIIVSKHESCGLTPAVSKASAGAIEYVPIVQVANLAAISDILKKRGVWLFGAEAKGRQYWTEADFTLPLALLLGSEGKGLKNILKKKCDFLIALPMKGHISSLNVAATGAILMYEVVRQRNW